MVELDFLTCCLRNSMETAEADMGVSSEGGYSGEGHSSPSVGSLDGAPAPYKAKLSPNPT